MIILWSGEVVRSQERWHEHVGVSMHLGEVWEFPRSTHPKTVSIAICCTGCPWIISDFIICEYACATEKISTGAGIKNLSSPNLKMEIWSQPF